AQILVGFLVVYIAVAEVTEVDDGRIPRIRGTQLDAASLIIGAEFVAIVHLDQLPSEPVAALHAFSAVFALLVGLLNVEVVARATLVTGERSLIPDGGEVRIVALLRILLVARG